MWPQIVQATVNPADNAPSLYKHKFCALTRVRNIPRTVAEWIEYHAALGVGHFFIVDDCSTDDGKTRAVLDIYRQAGLVSLYDADDVTQDECGHILEARKTSLGQTESKDEAPAAATEDECGHIIEAKAKSQKLSEDDERVLAATIEDFQDDPAFQQCRYACNQMHTPSERRLFKYLFQKIQRVDGGRHCDWVMTFDPDEYLTIQRDLHPSGDLVSMLVEHEQQTRGFPVLHVPWVWMGSEHRELRPPDLLIDNFRVGHYPAWMLKTAARSAYIKEWDFSHWPIVKDVMKDALAVHGFAIPEPFESLAEYTARNWLFDNESRVIRPDPANPTVECRYPVSPLFLKHYAYRSFEEFRAYRANPANLRVKSDGNENNVPLKQPREAWEGGWGVHNPSNFENPCALYYANDFTASMAERTRTALAAREKQWNREHGFAVEREWAPWHGRRGYGGPFPPIEEWVL